jgi:hypothetical protein
MSILKIIGKAAWSLGFAALCAIALAAWVCNGFR